MCCFGFTTASYNELQERIANSICDATILDKIKWNSKPPTLPPKSRMKPRKSQKAPFSHPWFGGRGFRFSIYFVQGCSPGNLANRPKRLWAARYMRVIMSTEKMEFAMLHRRYRLEFCSVKPPQCFRIKTPFIPVRGQKKIPSGLKWQNDCRSRNYFRLYHVRIHTKWNFNVFRLLYNS